MEREEELKQKLQEAQKEIEELKAEIDRLNGILRNEDKLHVAAEDHDQTSDREVLQQRDDKSNGASKAEATTNVCDAALREYTPGHDLTREDIERYSRQLIFCDMGVGTQQKLLRASVAVVGAGGLGSPALLYLAAAGVGRLGIFDDDVVDVSNLHRQIIHTTESVQAKMNKAESAAKAIERLNPRVMVDIYKERISPNNALRHLSSFDVILDCTDNVPTRYLLSDVAVRLNKPLVSGSAIRGYGQITVYHYHPEGMEMGPCYRCLFPKPPPAESVQNCSDTGVVGSVVGIVGSMQAMETIKIISKKHENNILTSKMIIIDAFHSTYRTVSLRKRNPQCEACGIHPSVTSDDTSFYEEFCGTHATDKPAQVENEDESMCISCIQTNELILQDPSGIQLIDVREPVQYDICSLPNSINIPLKNIEENMNKLSQISQEKGRLLMLCRRGIDSMEATRILRSKGIDNAYNIKGGLTNWSKTVDPNCPLY